MLPGRADRAAEARARLLDLIDSLPTGERIPAERDLAERWSPGKLAERRVFEHVIRPHEVFGQPLVVQLWPADGIPEPAATGSPSLSAAGGTSTIDSRRPNRARSRRCSTRN